MCGAQRVGEVTTYLTSLKAIHANLIHTDKGKFTKWLPQNHWLVASRRHYSSDLHDLTKAPGAERHAYARALDAAGGEELSDRVEVNVPPLHRRTLFV